MLHLIEILNRADVTISISKSDEGEYAITMTGCPLVFINRDLETAAQLALDGMWFYATKEGA